MAEDFIYVTHRVIDADRSNVQVISRDVAAMVGEYANLLKKGFRAHAPVNKNPRAPSRGTLRDSIVHFRSGSANTNSIVYTFDAVSYINYVSGGTGPHRITGAHGLSFIWDVSMSAHGPFSRAIHGSPVPRAPKVRISAKSVRLSTQGAVTYNSSKASQKGYFGGSKQSIAGGSGSKGGTASKYPGYTYLPSVMHPGTKPNDFIERALADAEPAFVALQDEVDGWCSASINQIFAVNPMAGYTREV